jgi:alkanesulfonate monooxygenase SsuD/methylene tetrahydromethanopterin reductase-like flavin-dependent oxidoreductase (luciferase family)
MRSMLSSRIHCRELDHAPTWGIFPAAALISPSRPIPLLTAANGKKSMRLAGLHGDGLITDPHTWH